MNEREQINKEAELLILLSTVAEDCLIYRGIEEKYVIISKSFTGNYGLGRIVDCNHIHKIIEESGKNGMYPKEIFKEFCKKGWLDD